MKDFYTKVYEIVEQIPQGRVTTYGAIAQALGAGRSSRLVGIAMNHSHELLSNLPAHRVVNRNGMLTGKHHFTGRKTMEELLSSEGIKVVDDVVENFKKIFWNPKEEL